jgi:hypothetical protein
MYSLEVHYLIHQEMHKDLRRDIARHQLIRTAMLWQPDNKDRLRRIAGRIGVQLVKWGSKLQYYDQGQHQTLIQRG